jgi:hypothetical protein
MPFQDAYWAMPIDTTFITSYLRNDASITKGGRVRAMEKNTSETVVKEEDSIAEYQNAFALRQLGYRKSVFFFIAYSAFFYLSTSAEFFDFATVLYVPVTIALSGVLTSIVIVPLQMKIERSLGPALLWLNILVDVVGYYLVVSAMFKVFY